METLTSFKLNLELDMIYEEGITQDEDIKLFDIAKDDEYKRNLIDQLKEKYKDHNWVEFKNRFQQDVLNISKKQASILLEEQNKYVELNFDLEAKMEYHKNISKFQVQQQKVLFAKIPEDQKQSFTEQINTIKDFDKYDVQINFDIAKLLTQGVEIKYRKDMSKDYKKEILSKKTVKHYAVLGEFKVGKSWFMSQLSGKQLRQGYTFVTEGICLIYDAPLDEKQLTGNCCYIDTAGFGEAQQSYIRYHQLVKRLKDLQTPLSYSEAITDMPTIQEVENQKEMEQYIKDEEERIDSNYESEQNKCIVNEIFVQRFVLEISTAIYLMVGQMTGQEETFLNFIIKEIGNNTKKYRSIKKIFVIHNYQQLTTVKEVEDQILKDIIKCQNVQYKSVKTVAKGYYLQKVTQDLNAYHYTTAQEGSPAGKFYNEFTFEQIKASQANDQTDITSNNSSIPQKLSFFINNNMLNYCKIQIKDNIRNREIVEQAYDKFEKALELCSKNIDNKDIPKKIRQCVAYLNQSSSMISLNKLKLIENSIDINIKNIAITKTGKQNEVAIKNMYLPEYSIHLYEKEQCFKIFVDVSCYVMNSFSGKVIQIKEKVQKSGSAIQTSQLLSTSFFIEGRRVPYNKKEIKVGDKNQFQNLIGLQFGNIAYHIPIDQFIDLDQYRLEDFPLNNKPNNNEPQQSNNKNIIYHSYGIIEYIIQFKK